MSRQFFTRSTALPPKELPIFTKQRAGSAQVSVWASEEIICNLFPESNHDLSAVQPVALPLYCYAILVLNLESRKKDIPGI
jgi:hypothetical protein